MKDTLIAGLWLALVIGLPAAAGAGSVTLGLSLFLVAFLAFGVVPIVRMKTKAEASRANDDCT